MPSKEYRVSGNLSVFGNKPGERFAREIPELQEARLVKAGHIKPVQQGESPKPDINKEKN